MAIMKLYEAMCDKCLEVEYSHSTLVQFKSKLKKDGWTINKYQSFCSDCKPDYRVARGCLKTDESEKQG